MAAFFQIFDMNYDPVSFLEKKGVKPTAMRILVFEHLQDHPVAHSLARLEAHFAYSDRITLYRTLKIFQKKGVVHAIDDGSGATKYAICDEDCSEHYHVNFHPHFHCTECGETVCLEDTKVADIHIPPGFQIHEAQIVFSGICNKCGNS